MPSASFRFYQELNDFLDPSRHKCEFRHEWKGRASVKDLIESIGVPHTEVDLILANGESVPFSYLAQEGDRISVYPVFESMDIGAVSRLRPSPLRQIRFVLDGHLGRLAAYLRLLGFDSLWNSQLADQELARTSQQDQRILLTRDRGLLKRKAVTHGYFVRSTLPADQLLEVVDRFDLRSRAQPFTRCASCNGLLEPVPAAQVQHQLEPGTATHYHQFWSCTSCRKVYWQGSHYRRIRQLLDPILSAGP
ncbi:MAG: Mut7-C RNAse domain-containing protein [Anaerolineales bacterium]|jgi:uncharacterized protein with PIN domain/sulfur carrier protein ThiS